MTERSGTLSPSRYHHLASHMWHVVKDRSLPPTFMEIEMRSPWWQTGQVTSGLRSMPQSSTVEGTRAHSTEVSDLRAGTGHAAVRRDGPTAGRPGDTAPGGRAAIRQRPPRQRADR